MTIAGLSACATLLDAASCLDWYRSVLPAECRPAGTLPNGASCLYSSQCAARDCFSSGTWCGKCQERVAVGGPCHVGLNTCDAGLVCAKGCVVQGGACQNLNGHCAAPVLEGSACQQSSDCREDLVCYSGVCSQPSQLGQPCPQGSECDRTEDLACVRGSDGVSRTCTRMSYAATGQTCDPLNGLTCILGSDCTGTCKAQIADDEPCSQLKDCMQPAFCSNGTCTYPPASSCQ
jgi:hypothetical protein